MNDTTAEEAIVLLLESLRRCHGAHPHDVAKARALLDRIARERDRPEAAR